MRKFVYGAAGILVVAALSNGFAASTGANVTPETSAYELDSITTAQDAAPPQCAGMGLTSVVSGSGSLSGTSGNDLITGSGANDTIDGKSGDDCIVGGDGNDSLNGGAGNDVILGGAGDDAIDGGAHTDVCDGGGQAGDTFSKCETVVP